MLQNQAPGSDSALTPRIQKPSVKDPRLIVGILLVAVSMWIGIWTVNSAKNLSVAFIAVEPLVEGQQVTQSQLKAVEVNLGESAELYQSAVLESGRVYIAQQTVGAGELVVKESLGSDASTDYKVIAISVTGTLPNGIAAGSKVDLWAVPKNPAQDKVEPTQVATDLTVSQKPEKSTGFSATAQQTIFVLVPTDSVSQVLAVSTGDYVLSLLTEPQAAL